MKVKLGVITYDVYRLKKKFCIQNFIMTRICLVKSLKGNVHPVFGRRNLTGGSGGHQNGCDRVVTGEIWKGYTRYRVGGT